MLTITKPAANRVDIHLDGKIDADMMSSALDDLLEKSDGVTNGVMLYRISEFALPTLAAIGVELARVPRLFGLLSRFDRCAVLSDVAWLRKAAVIEGAILPGLDIRAFALDETEAAEAWLAE